MQQIRTSRNKDRVLKYILEGKSIREASRITGISAKSVYRWSLVDEAFKRRLEKVKSIKYKALIEDNLESLANGVEQVERKEEVFTKNEETGEYTKVSTKVTKLAPNINAIKMLASRYEKNTYKDSNESSINITITQRDRALTLDERLKILNDDSIEGECIELEETK